MLSWTSSLNILAYFCSLEIVLCCDSMINSKKNNKCTKENICICPATAKVPLIEREYLQDQYSKTRPNEGPIC